MKLGLLTAILGDKTFEEVVKTASRIGYQCLEVACWPKGKAERRYAGVSHIDVDNIDDSEKKRILALCKDNDIAISALGYYPNTMDPDLAKREVYVSHLKNIIKAAARLGVDTVGTFVGRDPKRNVDDNLKIFSEVWPDIIRTAEENKVRIAIENCPMLFTNDEWPGGQNLATSPAIWRKLYEIVPSQNFGLNFDPSHFIWQQMDYIAAIREFGERIFHIHFKDIKLYPERLARLGVMATPLQYMSPKLPGLGDVDWSRFVSALYDIGYDGPACVEVEDRAFEGSPERVLASLELSYGYMRQWVR